MMSKASKGEGGRFGTRRSEGYEEDNNPFVLTALEASARQSPQHVQEEIYPIRHLQFSGNVSVTPASDPGACSVDLYLKHSGMDAGVHVRAEVRSTWITLTLRGHQEPSDKAAVLASALLALASIPDHQMVSVDRNRKALGVPNDLLEYAELLALVGD